MPGPTITIAICSYNRCEPLRRSLESLAALETHGAFGLEIVVVDDGSTDQTAEVVRRFAQSAPCEVQYVRQAGLGIAAARNHCLRKACGQWVAFFDDDQLAEPDWLHALYSVAQQKSVRCVGSARDLIIDNVDPVELSPITRAVLGELWHPVDHECRHRPMLSTGTVLIERSVFDEIGGFDETLMQGGSDSDLFARMRRAGIRQWFTPAAVVHHVIPPHRARAKFLLWCSRRNGVSFARQDVRDHGRLKAAGLAAARLGRTAFIVIPRALGYAVIGKTSRAVGQLCLAWRDYGYARNVAYLVLPGWTGGRKFLDGLDYRKERLPA